MSTIIIDASGNVRHLYSDELLDLDDVLGDLDIARASHVEPVGGDQWEADMSPVGGPVLGPFLNRQAALDAEVRWLEENGIPEVIHDTDLEN